MILCVCRCPYEGRDGYNGRDNPGEMMAFEPHGGGLRT